MLAQAKAQGVETFLVKPVSPSSLLDAILDVMGHGVERGPETVATLPAREQLRGARVLLVEDNDINQQVAAELLGQVGIQVTVANHGQAGLDMLSARPDRFDGVLMDIQMPVMDGYTAAREIRKDVRFKDLPVIAMTANAMAGDREKALKAGMNDHVAKPIDITELFEVLGRWLQVHESRRERAASATETTVAQEENLPDFPGLDVRSGLARCGGNLLVYRKILRRFAETQAATPQRIRAALAVGDHATAEREAHTLKGVAGNVGADAVQEAAKAVEACIKQGADVNASLGALEQPLGVLIERLASVLVLQKLAGVDEALPSSENLLPLLDRLEMLLNENDAAAGELVAHIELQLQDGELRRHIQPIIDRIDDFEFEDALELLQGFRSLLGTRDSDLG